MPHPQQITYAIAMAAGRDAAARNAANHGRRIWNADDYQIGAQLVTDLLAGNTARVPLTNKRTAGAD